MMEEIRLDLHLFDEYEINRTTDPIAGHTTNNLSPEMKTFYDKVLIKNAVPNLVHDQFGQKKPIPKGGGKTIEFRKYDPFDKATVPLTEGVTPPGHKMNVVPVTATVQQYGDYVTLSDVLILTAIDDNIVAATEILGNQAGETLDWVTREVLAAQMFKVFANKKQARANLVSTDTLSVNDVKRAVKKLKNGKAKKIDNYYVGIVCPDTAYDLMCDPEWISASEYAGSGQIFEGEIGKIAGVRFVETTEAKVFEDAGGSGNDTFDVYLTLIIGANAYGVTEVEGGGLQQFTKQLGSSGTADPLNQRATVGWKALKTAEILTEDFIVGIESAASQI